jgi:hypothetical protein
MASGSVISIPQSSMQTVNPGSRPRHAASFQDISIFSSRPVRDDDLLSQESFSLSSSLHHGSRGSHELDQWTKSESLASSPLSLAKLEPPEVQMLPYSLSQQYMPSTTGHSNVADAAMFPLSELQAVQGPADQNEMDLSQPQEYQNFVDLSSFDNDNCPSEVNQQCCTDDDMSVGYGSHNDDSKMITNGSWSSLRLDTGDFRGPPIDHFALSVLPAPVSPPLTEASNASVHSTCSQSGYPSFRGHEESLLGDNNNSTISGQNISLADSFFRMTPPLNDQDPNRFALCCCPFSSHNRC